jgi:hypothetical protein
MGSWDLIPTVTGIVSCGHPSPSYWSRTANVTSSSSRGNSLTRSSFRSLTVNKPGDRPDRRRPGPHHAIRAGGRRVGRAHCGQKDGEGLRSCVEARIRPRRRRLRVGHMPRIMIAADSPDRRRSRGREGIPYSILNDPGATE